VTRELDEVTCGKLQDVLKALSNLHESILIAPLCAGGSSPNTDTVESLTNVDDNTHNLVGGIGLESLSDGRKHNVQPELVDVDTTLVLELVGPFSSVLVLDIFPLGTDTLLEKVVVGLEGKVGGLGDVVLSQKVSM
jgi:hypothetical protein